MKYRFGKTAALFIAAALVCSADAQLPQIVSAEPLDSGADVCAVYAVESEPSEYGLVNVKYVDEYGNEVFIDDGKSEPYNSAQVYPASYDLRNYGMVTGVKDQGKSGNCWAFATIGALESSFLKKGLGTSSNTDFSEAHLVWFAQRSYVSDTNDPTRGDGFTKQSPYESGGNHWTATSALARGSGAELESSFPFYPYDLSKMGYYSESDRYRTYARLTQENNIDAGDRNSIKSAIMNTGAVVTSYYSDKQYLNTGNYSYYCDYDYDTNHEVIVVGWNDNYSKDNFKSGCRPSANGAWLCRNSWGTDWGNSGYFWLSYSDMTLGSFISFEADMQEFDNEYQYTGYYGGSSIYYQNRSTIYGANIFRSKDYEKLTSVSFNTVNMNTQYKIEIYTDIPESSADPTSGVLASSATVSGTEQYRGFHTVDLRTEVSLSPGERYAVVITLSVGEGKANLPLETGTYAHSEPGQSYYSSNKSTWTDSNSKGYGNVVLRAYTCYSKGDLNKDGTVSAADITLLKKAVAGLVTFTGSDFDKADINSDGKLTSKDVTLLKRRVYIG